MSGRRSDRRSDYTCPECGFTSTGWPTVEDAEARGQQHAAEHATGEAMPELDVFRRERNIGPDGQAL